MHDLTQPTAEGLRNAQLVDLLHRLNEHVLRQFLGFVCVADAAHRQRHDSAAVSFEQFAEGVSLARLGSANQVGDGSSL